ncbi:MAG: hypothetical protein AABZ31_02645, partial [Bdellovibrionota bacterium]
MSLTIMLILAGAASSRAETPGAAKSASINMDDYLSQVAGGNPAYRAAQEGFEGAKKRSSEKNVLFLPQISVMYQEGRNEKPTFNQNIDGERTDTSEYNIGIEKDFSTGTNLKLNYGTHYRDTIGAG